MKLVLSALTIVIFTLQGCESFSLNDIGNLVKRIVHFDKPSTEMRTDCGREIADVSAKQLEIESELDAVKAQLVDGVNSLRGQLTDIMDIETSSSLAFDDDFHLKDPYFQAYRIYFTKRATSFVPYLKWQRLRNNNAATVFVELKWVTDYNVYPEDFQLVAGEEGIHILRIKLSCERHSKDQNLWRWLVFDSCSRALNPQVVGELKFKENSETSYSFQAICT